MPAQQIATTLPLINWTVLAGLAVGSFVVVVLARLVTPATKGFLAFTAACAAGFGLLAYLSDTSLPVIGADAVVTGDPTYDMPRRAALLAFVLLAAVSMLLLARGRQARVVLVLGFAAGVLTLVLGALTWGDGPLGAIPLAVQLLILAAATGGVFAAMILGHWYLVTPKLPEAPLVMVSRRLMWIVAIQLALFAGWVGFGMGPGATGGPFAALFGPYALFVWLRLIVGLIFPLIVSWAALQTAKTRSMESATGLLYINVGTITSGTILAAGLYFGAGLLV
ncbi:MAG TPA: hypothetical protein VFQ75_12135 [Candidatus Limnocylindrales bacterium]|nr:hypothetical protein [Candidatus Limnocylindrales bacterium]